MTVVMPAKSTYTFPARFISAPKLVRLHRGEHPGVREVAHGEHVIELSPTRLRPYDRWVVCVTARRHCDDYTAHWLAMRKVVSMSLLGNAGRPYEVLWHGAPPVGFPWAATSGRLPIGGYVLFGFVAGLSAALGFLVPPVSRLSAAQPAST